ncbi:S8 family peptidase [Nocardia farcinica]|uniref:S8 family peptidase n=1 Tax=Nocardia farcinica TaxID=37329 RepID=UPI000E1B99B9|nr:S8 family peptidase [Nocardia farcinica]
MDEGQRQLDHLYVPEHAATQDFHRSAGGGAKIRQVDRRTHGHALRGELDDAFTELDRKREVVELGANELRALGTIIVLEGADSTCPLRLDSLNSFSQHTKTPRKPRWLLLSVRGATETEPERATVWVSDAYRSAFLKLFEDYLDKETASGNPKNQALVANISRIRHAVLADLWTSEGEPPQRGMCWWEIWLDATTEGEGALRQFLTTFEIRALRRSIRLRDRLVFWIETTWQQLEVLPFTNVPVAEIRRPEFVDTVEDLPADGQDEFVTDLASRLRPASLEAPAVCHLDTGVFREHVLLRDSLAPEDHHSIIGSNANDVHPSGHGTSMAGLALFGNLDPHLVTNGFVELRHRLESVRMTPEYGESDIDPLDYGSATVEAVTLPEITNPRRRVYCLTLSATPDNPGEPTLWSAAVDALAAGTDSIRSGDQFQLLSAPDPDSGRLIIVAAGNVDRYTADYRTESDTSAIEDPAQAWNALTVGAYTNMVETPQDPQYNGWTPLAGAGELSPHSRTSVMFNQRKWPIKPDICFEGGNVLTDGVQSFETKHAVVSLRTTGTRNDLALTSANATSAATAQAARVAALAMDRYPDYWPETIRGLMTHSAEWTPAMDAEVKADPSKAARLQLLRRYGWGVPAEGAVLNSSQQAVTLVTQDQFRPFAGGDYRMRCFRLHTLPWPTDVLEQLGDADVRLRITLSYFIEPSASRRGWRNRYLYASHGLRFDLQGPLETQQAFVSRVNREAQSEEEGTARPGTTSGRWLLGERQRSLGSLHQDEWHGTGTELARCNSVAVYPVGGWWKNTTNPDRKNSPVRYALLLSLRTARQGIDLYSPIATQLAIPVPTHITS